MEIPAPVTGTVSKLLVSQGDSVSVGQHVMSFEGDVAAASGPAAAPEVVEEAPKEEPPAAEPAPVVEEAPVAAPAPVVEEAPAPPPAPAPVKAKAVSAAPNVRRLARELGIDIKSVSASAESGRISLDDVKSHARSLLSGGGGALGTPAGAPGVQGQIRTEKMNAIRKATAQHMAHCWATIPHVTQHDTADITRLNALRKRLMPQAEAQEPS